MGFQDFLGNTQTATHLRESIRAERFPHSLILAGPSGAGKYTLALMLANACGGFLYLAIHAVWGEIFKHHKGLVLGNFAAGFAVIAGLILYFHLKA